MAELLLFRREVGCSITCQMTEAGARQMRLLALNAWLQELLALLRSAYGVKCCGVEGFGAVFYQPEWGMLFVPDGSLKQLVDAVSGWVKKNA